MSTDSELMRQVADLQQRLTRAEERLEQGDPRTTEALETAREALASAATAAEVRKITERLEAELKAVSSRVPRSKSVPAADPVNPDPDPQLDDPQNAPAPPSTPQPTHDGSTSPALPSGTRQKKRRF